MKRDYETGEHDNVVFFSGIEVEHTPAYGMPTLFVTGVQPVEEIEKRLGSCNHIFFGANHSFDPENVLNDKSAYDYYKEWEDMIEHFLNKDILCTLDIPLSAAQGTFHDGGLCEKDNFIPQIRVPLPYTKLWNYNTMIKIDDVDFKATNPGVWCHSLHDLMDREKFTDWSKYGLDNVIE